jgi:hypothetical protein
MTSLSLSNVVLIMLCKNSLMVRLKSRAVTRDLIRQGVVGLSANLNWRSVSAGERVGLLMNPCNDHLRCYYWK